MLRSFAASAGCALRDLEPPGANAAPGLLRGHRPGQRTAAGRMEVVFPIRKLAIANIAARAVWVHPLMRLCLDAGRRDSGLADFRTALSNNEHIAAPGLRGSDVGGDRRPDADLAGDIRGLGRADHQHHQRSRRRIPEGGRPHHLLRGDAHGRHRVSSNRRRAWRTAGRDDHRRIAVFLRAGIDGRHDGEGADPRFNAQQGRPTCGMASTPGGVSERRPVFAEPFT